MTLTPGVPASIAITDPPNVTQQAGIAWDNVVVNILDAEGNLTTNNNSTSVDLTEDGPGAFNGGTPSALVTGGVHTFAGLRYDAKRPMAVFMMREGMLNEAIYGRTDARTALLRLKEQLERGGPPSGKGGE